MHYSIVSELCIEAKEGPSLPHALYWHRMCTIRDIESVSDGTVVVYSILFSNYFPIPNLRCKLSEIRSWMRRKGWHRAVEQSQKIYWWDIKLYYGNLFFLMKSAAGLVSYILETLRHSKRACDQKIQFWFLLHMLEVCGGIGSRIIQSSHQNYSQNSSINP